ncbi:MAG: glycerate kinase [Hydrogenophaga sp.]|uniref:glycerate kinase n=1 Tax=Hydrogenophaga sp. TaxID=1904254 RepID=UPI0027230FB4|nr:glycerate kinase [Hydrogenophaga sp.]MDO9148495.1 glycerate kinase [Hydrogenophaga sp.]MDO9605216.1 glycerate kinase [Hydrogenophaga sp.]MDP2163531.1 glycerate kinase [Hydrogenophaga sp.]MDP3474848.1 glycerate kinase [Hydrogenophaga sp.]
MTLQKILVALAGIVLVAMAYQTYGWPGVAAALGAVMMWVMLHFTRLMTVLKRAANRPIGHVGSAVMFNVKLKRGVTLMHVIAMTRSLGERLSPEGEEPERFRWTDTGGSAVTADFQGGKLVQWTLQRPQSDEVIPASSVAAPAPGTAP